MSATNTKLTFLDIQRILEISLPVSLHMWAGANDFMRSDMLINLISSSEFKYGIISHFSKYINCADRDHLLVYSNSKTCTTLLRKKLQIIFREKLLLGYQFINW